MSAKNDRFSGNPQFSTGRRCCQPRFAKLSDLLRFIEEVLKCGVGEGWKRSVGLIM
jgi:hypothetical protein